MKFQLLDHILECTPERIVAIKQVSLAEEYLADHFPGFPVLPGVMMVETLVQAARELLSARSDHRLVLGQVKALKFGQMVRPGESLQVEVTLTKVLEGDCYNCKGVGRVRRQSATSKDGPQDETAVSGRFTMRPICHTE